MSLSYKCNKTAVLKRFFIMPPTSKSLRGDILLLGSIIFLRNGTEQDPLSLGGCLVPVGGHFYLIIVNDFFSDILWFISKTNLFSLFSGDFSQSCCFLKHFMGEFSRLSHFVCEIASTNHGRKLLDKSWIFCYNEFNIPVVLKCPGFSLQIIMHFKVQNSELEFYQCGVCYRMNIKIITAMYALASRKTSTSVFMSELKCLH